MSYQNRGVREKAEKKFREALDDGKTLVDYKKALQNALAIEEPDSSAYASIICNSDITVEVKAALLRAMHKLKLPIVNANRWDTRNCVMAIALEKHDLKLIKVLHDLNVDFPSTRGYYNRSACKAINDIGANNAEVAINLITKYKLKSEFIIEILKGALQESNMPVIKYLVEIEKINMRALTRASSSVYNLTNYIHTNFPMIKYLQKHGYNIHCCKRALLKRVCQQNTPSAKHIRDYIIEDQLKTQPGYAQLYMEDISYRAYRNNDIDFIEKFPYQGRIQLYVDDLVNAFKNTNLAMVKSISMRFIRYKCRWYIYQNNITGWYLSPLGQKTMRRIKEVAPKSGPVFDYMKEYFIRFSREWDGKRLMAALGETQAQLENFTERRNAARTQMQAEFQAEKKWLDEMVRQCSYEGQEVKEDAGDDVSDFASRIFAEAAKKEQQKEREILSLYYQGPPSDSEDSWDGPEMPEADNVDDNI